MLSCCGVKSVVRGDGKFVVMIALAVVVVPTSLERIYNPNPTYTLTGRMETAITLYMSSGSLHVVHFWSQNTRMLLTSIYLR
jgi:hypothetical protein